MATGKPPGGKQKKGAQEQSGPATRSTLGGRDAKKPVHEQPLPRFELPPFEVPRFWSSPRGQGTPSGLPERLPTGALGRTTPEQEEKEVLAKENIPATVPDPDLRRKTEGELQTLHRKDSAIGKLVEDAEAKCPPGRAVLLANNIADAIRATEEGVSVLPTLTARADAELTEQVATSTKLIELDSNNADHFIGRGAAYFAKKEYRRAAEDFSHAALIASGVSKAARSTITAKFRVEIARATRPKWRDRLLRGGELATLTAPSFLKRVHAEEIGHDGTIHNEVIRAIDSELMQAVELYISKRRKRNRDLGDAEGLKFILTRPRVHARSAKQARRPRN
jgi:hypothetical protein